MADIRAQRTAEFVIAAGMVIVPLSVFTYIPTQDGPSHLANSRIIAEMFASEPEYLRDCYDIVVTPIPNWTCFAFLSVTSSLLPMLFAEKILAVAYVMGFGLGLWYFASGLGNLSPVIVMASMLLVLNRCFWLGFYNYCLSVDLLFAILGFLVRRRTLTVGSGAVLCGLFLVSYFTHIFGLLTAVICSLIVSWDIKVPFRQLMAPLVLAMCPSLMLSGWFFVTAGFAGEAGSGKLVAHVNELIHGDQQFERVKVDLKRYANEVWPLGDVLAVLMQVSICAVVLRELVGVFRRWRTKDSVGQQTASPAVDLVPMCVALAVLYFVLPDVLTLGKGGFWKTRLAPLIPALYLPAIQIRTRTEVRIAYAWVGCLLLLQGYEQYSYCKTQNASLEQFCSGIEPLGSGNVLFFMINSEGNRLIDPMLHAGDYYCLDDRRNVNTGVHFATLDHSIVRLRPGIKEATPGMRLRDYANAERVDAIVSWGVPDGDSPGFGLVFKSGQLSILRRMPAGQ